MIRTIVYNLFQIQRNASDPSISQIFFTSGTTGDPKMVVHDNTYPFALGITGITNLSSF